jgi:hypothetical protein
MIVLGEQCAWNDEFLDFNPLLVHFVSALERDRIRELGRRVIQPLKGISHVLGVFAFPTLLSAELF